MSQNLPEIDVLFVAGFGPISQNAEDSSDFYIQVLGLPLKPMEGNCDYLLSENRLKGVKHFAVWPLSQAANSCFGTEQWPTEYPIPQGWIEYEVQDLDAATRILSEKGYHLLVANRTEPWGKPLRVCLALKGCSQG
jgi:hypothetical protein